MSGADGPVLAASGATVALVDGAPAQAIGLADRGLHYGDGVFETIVAVRGALRFEALHRARLRSGCERLRLTVDVDLCFAELRTLAAGGDGILKLIVTRGDALARGYALTGHERARRIVLRYPPSDGARDDEARERGIIVRSAQTVLGENPALAGLKHLNRLEQVLARQEAPPEVAAELLMSSGSGLVVSGTMSNVFLVHDRTLLTPSLERCGVAGVTRAVILREARALGITAAEREVRPAHLAGASEIFVSNARIGIWPVRELDGRSIAIGPVTRSLQAQLAKLDA